MKQLSVDERENGGNWAMSAYEEITIPLERKLCAYTGADFAVLVNSCTSAIMLCCDYLRVQNVSLPKFTYRSIPMAILLSGARERGGGVSFDNREWVGCHSLDPYPIIDSARRFRAGMCQEYERMLPGPRSKYYACVSFHHTKILRGDSGGAILHNDPAADSRFRRLRHDGRTDGLSVHDDPVDCIGYRVPISTGDVAGLLSRLEVLPQYNEDVIAPPGHFPDLSLTDWNGIYDRQRNR